MKGRIFADSKQSYESEILQKKSTATTTPVL